MQEMGYEWNTLLSCSFLYFFFSCMNVEDFVDDCYKKGGIP